MNRTNVAMTLDATTRTMIGVMAALIHADPGTDFATYYAEVAEVAEAWEMDTLLSARATVDLLPESPTSFTATWIFQAEITHRQTGRPRLTADQLRVTWF